LRGLLADVARDRGLLRVQSQDAPSDEEVSS
jgi:hypothetical protein